MCDMRSQSKYSDGVPDNVIEEIVQKMTETVFLGIAGKEI
jgi:hypothetical protein